MAFYFIISKLSVAAQFECEDERFFSTHFTTFDEGTATTAEEKSNKTKLRKKMDLKKLNCSGFMNFRCNPERIEIDRAKKKKEKWIFMHFYSSISVALLLY